MITCGKCVAGGSTRTNSEALSDFINVTVFELDDAAADDDDEDEDEEEDEVDEGLFIDEFNDRRRSLLLYFGWSNISRGLYIGTWNIIY